MSGYVLQPWAMHLIHTISLAILLYFSALQIVLFGLLILSFFEL